MQTDVCKGNYGKMQSVKERERESRGILEVDGFPMGKKTPDICRTVPRSPDPAAEPVTRKGNL